MPEENEGELLAPARFEHFLDLPTEIRVMIYDVALLVEGRLRPLVDWGGYACDVQFTTALLRVCKLISAEAMPRFYEVNTFHLVRQPRKPDTFQSQEPSYLMCDWLDNLKDKAAWLRHIVLDITPTCEADIEWVPDNIKKLLKKAPSLCTLSIRYNPVQFQGFGGEERPKWPHWTLFPGSFEELWDGLHEAIEEASLDIDERLHFIPDRDLWPSDDPDYWPWEEPQSPGAPSGSELLALYNAAFPADDDDDDQDEDQEDDDEE